MDEPRNIGEWTLICVLGAGAFGKVTLWSNQRTQEQIAIKTCKFHLPEKLTKRQRERWINEVEIMKLLRNDNLVQYKQLPQHLEKTLGQFNPTGLPMLPMEYCRKGNLRKFLLQPRNLKGCDESDVRCILGDTANAISYLHSRNITHRDIKPENIVIQECDTRPGRNIYKVIDLGYAKELETIASFVGTLPYLAPEIFKNEAYNHSVDYWSLGILTYEIITGVLPFVPNRTPVERFKYLKEKSDDHIAISLSRDNVPKFSSEILADNRLCSTFRQLIGEWLRLVLAYDGSKRGLRRGARVDVFEELRLTMNRKMLKVFSVYDYRCVDCEVEEFTRLSDVKPFIERATGIAADLQMFAVDADTMLLDDTNIGALFKGNQQLTLYVFKKNHDYQCRKVIIPTPVQRFFVSSLTDESVEVLKACSLHAMSFARDEKELMEQFDSAIMTQNEYSVRLFQRMKKRYCDVRCSLLGLLTQVQCYHEYQEWRIQSSLIESDSYRRIVMEIGRYLRQTKELVECFNGLTEKYLKVLTEPKLARFSDSADVCRRILCENETNMVKLYDNAEKLYQKVSRADMSTNEMSKTLSDVMKVPRNGIFRNEELRDNLRRSLWVQRKLSKLWVTCCAIGAEVNRVSEELRLRERARSEHERNRRLDPDNERLCSSFQRYFDADMISVDQLCDVNISLRLHFQEISDQMSLTFRSVQQDLVSSNCIWSVLSHSSQRGQR